MVCLELAQETLNRKVPVLLIDPDSERDFTGGKAWEIIQEIIGAGGQVVSDVEAVFDLLCSGIKELSDER